MSAAQSGRKSELSWLNLMFCAMVLWSHSSSYALTHLDHSSWAYALVFSLQRVCFISVYGFFFLSGLKLTLSKKKPPLLTFWKRRANTILLPYCLAVAVYYYWFCKVIGWLTPSLSGYLGFLIRGDLSAQFYFVVVLVQFILLTPLMQRLAEYSPALLLPAAVLISLLSNMYFNDILNVFVPGAWFPYSDRIFSSYLVYYLAGCCAGRRYGDFLAMLEKNRGIIAGGTLCVILSDLVFCWFGYARQRPIPFAVPVAMLHYLSATLLCFLVALRLPKRMPRWLAEVDRTSFLIYLYHVLALLVIDKVLDHFGIYKVSVHFLFRASFVYLATPLAGIIWQHLWAAVKEKFVRPKAV